MGRWSRRYCSRSGEKIVGEGWGGRWVEEGGGGDVEERGCEEG